MSHPNAKIMESLMEQVKSLDELPQLLRNNAPDKRNCFLCKARAFSNCPVFESTNTEIDTLFLMAPEFTKIISCYCVTGCGCFME